MSRVQGIHLGVSCVKNSCKPALWSFELLYFYYGVVFLRYCAGLDGLDSPLLVFLCRPV